MYIASAGGSIQHEVVWNNAHVTDGIAHRIMISVEERTATLRIDAREFRPKRLAGPVFVLFSLVAVVDGLVQRDLRRWGGGS